MKKAETDGQVIAALTIDELCRFCNADSAWVIELVEHGALDPKGNARTEWTFHAASIARARKARRLQRDFEVNAAGIAIILDLLEERDALRRALAVSGRASHPVE